jgi:hypothetical protein
MDRTPKPHQHVSDEMPEFDVDSLLAKAGVILQREIRALMAASARGKLDTAESRDLIAYVKLLAETKAQLEDASKNMSTEELKKLV